MFKTVIKKYNNQEIHLYSLRILNNLNATLKRNVVTGNFFKPYQNLVAKQGSINGVQVRTRTKNTAQIYYSHIHIRTMLSGVIKTSSKFSPTLRYPGSSSRSVLVNPKADIDLASNKAIVLQRSMATIRGVKLSKSVAKEFKNDGYGNHTHVTKETCIQELCSNKKCTELCDDPQETKILGHNTHKAPIGRFARFISAEDSTGVKQAQYFVKCNQKKVITPEDKNKYSANGLKTDKKQTDFINKERDKYED